MKPIHNILMIWHHSIAYTQSRKISLKHLNSFMFENSLIKNSEIIPLFALVFSRYCFKPNILHNKLTK